MGLVNKDQKREFPVGPVDETPHSQCRRTYSTPRWGSQVPHTTTQPRSPSWTGHSEDTGLLKQETEARRRKTALKTSHQRTRPTAKRATDPRRQPDPHPPFTEPQTLPTWARGAVQNQDGTWPWTGYHLPHQRQESLQPVPLLRSLPRSTPFPDPGQGHARAPQWSWLSDEWRISPHPAKRRARCSAALGSQDPAEAPELTGTSWAAATPTGRARVASWAPPTGTVSYMPLRDDPAHPHLDFSGIGEHPQATWRGVWGDCGPD